MSLIQVNTKAWAGTSGLVGTIAYQVLDVNNATLIPRTTVGVTEIPRGSGLYSATFTEPAVGYKVVWDDGARYDEQDWKIPASLQVITPYQAASFGSTTVIRNLFSINGVPADMQSVKFGDETGTLGVVRTDTKANVVGAGVSLVHASTGLYTYGPFNDPAVGLTYDYYLTIVDPSGNTSYLPAQTISGGGLPNSPYLNYVAFLRRWGARNIAQYSNKDKTQTSSNLVPDYGSVQDAFNYATEEINAAFRNSSIAVPLLFSGGTPASVSNWASILAYNFLYTSRAIESDDKVAGSLLSLETQVRMDMSFYRNGLKKFDSPTYVTATDGSGIEAQDASPVIVYPIDVTFDSIARGWLFGFMDVAPRLFGGTI